MTPKPRILVLFGSAVVFGAERGNLEALMVLKDQGAEILCLVRDEIWSTVVPPALEARAIPFRKVPYIEQWRRSRAHVVLLRGPIAFIVANWRFLQTVSEFKPTHIHAYGQLFVLNFLIGLMLVRTPLIFRAGDEPTMHNFFWRVTWQFVVRRTAHFVANSKFVVKFLKESGVAADLITLIYNAPPRRAASTRVDGGLDLPTKVRLIAFIGQVSEQKGVHLLVEAFRRLAAEFQDTHLAIAGRISDWEGDVWARVLRDSTLINSDIADRVHFLGEIETVSILLEQCTFLVVPSLISESSPNVIMEAKAAGRAVIGFPTGGISELINHGVDGWLCPEPNVESLQAAITNYLEDEGLTRVHGTAARESLETLDIPQFGQKWLEVYAAATRSKNPECPSPPARREHLTSTE